MKDVKDIWTSVMYFRANRVYVLVEKKGLNHTHFSFQKASSDGLPLPSEDPLCVRRARRPRQRAELRPAQRLVVLLQGRFTEAQPSVGPTRPHHAHDQRLRDSAHKVRFNVDMS